MIQIEGLIRIPVPGTLVRVSSLITQDAHGVLNDPTKFSCHACLIQAWHANTGKIFIGRADMVSATGVGVSTVLAIPTVNSIPAFSAALTLAPAGVDLSSLFLDAEVANEGVLVTVLVT